MSFYKIFGIFGILLITVGVITKNSRQTSLFYILGGILLEIYSIFIISTVMAF